MQLLNVQIGYKRALAWPKWILRNKMATLACTSIYTLKNKYNANKPYHAALLITLVTVDRLTNYSTVSWLAKMASDGREPKRLRVRSRYQLQLTFISEEAKTSFLTRLEAVRERLRPDGHHMRVLTPYGHGL